MYGGSRSANSSMLRISPVGRFLTVSLTPTPIGGSGIQSRSKQMLNLVDKYTKEVGAENEDGVVAIEYVLIAGLVAAGVAVAFGTTLWTELKGKLDAIIPG